MPPTRSTSSYTVAGSGEVYNLGSPDELTNYALCETLLKLVQPPGPTDVDAWIQSAPDRPFHDRGSGLNCSKLRSLGWEQTVSMEEGLRRTAAWYSAHGESWWGDIGKVFAKGVPIAESAVAPNPGFQNGVLNEAPKEILSVGSGVSV